MYCIVSIFVPLYNVKSLRQSETNAVLINFYPIVHRAINECRWVSYDRTGTGALSNQSGKNWTRWKLHCPTVAYSDGSNVSGLP